MTFSFPNIRSLAPTLSRVILIVGKHAGRIFLAGFIAFSLFGIALFYFFGYRFTQQRYAGATHLQGVNRGLLTQTLQQLQGQQSKAQSPPAANPFE